MELSTFTRLGRVPPRPYLDRVSIELTNRCGKACSFCYNQSHSRGSTEWTVGELVGLVRDLAAHGILAVSFGGGEPLQFDGLYEVLARTHGLVHRTMTTNGLLLDDHVTRLQDADLAKVHVSLHFPDRTHEVDRVIRQTCVLSERGIPSGINLLVRRSNLRDARRAVERATEAGITAERIMFLPMRGTDTPTPRELAQVAGTGRFASMTCLLSCGASPRFASIGWDRQAAWCSYTSSRRPLATLDYHGLVNALTGLELQTC